MVYLADCWMGCTVVKEKLETHTAIDQVQIFSYISNYSGNNNIYSKIRSRQGMWNSCNVTRVTDSGPCWINHTSIRSCQNISSKDAIRDIRLSQLTGITVTHCFMNCKDYTGSGDAVGRVAGDLDDNWYPCNYVKWSQVHQHLKPKILHFKFLIVAHTDCFPDIIRRNEANFWNNILQPVNK